MEDSGSYVRIDLDDSDWQQSNHATGAGYIEHFRRQLPRGLDQDGMLGAANGNMKYLADLVALLIDQPRARPVPKHDRAKWMRSE